MGIVTSHLLQHINLNRHCILNSKTYLKYGGDDAVVRRVEGDLEGKGVWGEVRAGADLYTRYLQAWAEGKAGLSGLDTGV